MHLQKTIALSLSLLLLGQQAVFASATAQSPSSARTLAQYQQQAKEDIQNAPWIKKHSNLLFALGGVALGSFVMGVMKDRYINNMQKIVAEEIKRNVAQVNLAKELPLQSAAKAPAVAPKTAAPKAVAQATQTAVARQTVTAPSRYLPYAALFYKNMSADGRILLRYQLAKEKWLTAAPKEQQKIFLELVDRASLAAHEGKKHLIDQQIRALANKQLKGNTNLLNILHTLFDKSKTLSVATTIGLLLVASAGSTDVQAQKMANRINRNFDLFLNASEEELARMEQDEEIRNICIEGANTLHEMSLLPRHEVEALMQDLPQPPAKQHTFQQLAY